MAGITLEQANTQLANWLALLTKLSTSDAKMVTYGDRHYTRRDIAEVQAEVDRWDQAVKQLERRAKGLNRSARVVPSW